MSGPAYKIHQELLLGISDHYMLNKIQDSFKTLRVAGGISGKVDGKVLHLMKAFEVPWVHDRDENMDPITNSSTITRTLKFFGPNKDLLKPDIGHLGSKNKLQEEMYPELSLVGLYITGETSSIKDVEKLAHDTFEKEAEGTILILLFNPGPLVNGSLDMKLFEKNNENDTFKELKIEMAAQAEETIALESVIRDLGANVQGGSGYCAVMDKTFVNGLDNYFTNLISADSLLCDDKN